MIIKNYLSTKSRNLKLSNLKPRTVKEQKIEYLRSIKDTSTVAHFCNSREAKEIIESGLQKNLINENQLIISYDNTPKGFRKIQKLSSKLNLKGINDIFCWSTGEKNGHSVDLLYQNLKKLKYRINIHDETFFMGRRKKRIHVYRNLKYVLGGESHVPSHFANDDYIDLLKSIIKKSNRDITHMDICAGQGSIGFSLFNETKKIKKLYCVEINPREVEQMKKTIKYNKLDESKINIIESNVLKSFPKDAKIDLMSANPPHTNRKAKNRADLQGADENWSFHRNLFLTIGKHLNDGGLVTLLENGATSSPKDFKPLIPNDLTLFKIKKITRTPWYILFIKKKSKK